MGYINVKEASIKWGISERRIRSLCADDRISGAKNMGKQWMIPSDAPRPVDGRTKDGKIHSGDSDYHFPVLVFSPLYSRVSELDEEYQTLFKAQTARSRCLSSFQEQG